MVFVSPHMAMHVSMHVPCTCVATVLSPQASVTRHPSELTARTRGHISEATAHMPVAKQTVWLGLILTMVLSVAPHVALMQTPSGAICTRDAYTCMIHVRVGSYMPLGRKIASKSSFTAAAFPWRRALRMVGGGGITGTRWTGGS